MNLKACNNRGEILLWQTPSWVTYACLTDHKGDLGERHGIAAQRAMRIYMNWVVGQLTGVWPDKEEFINLKESVDEHIRFIKEEIKRRGLKVEMI